MTRVSKMFAGGIFLQRELDRTSKTAQEEFLVNLLTLQVFKTYVSVLAVRVLPSSSFIHKLPLLSRYAAFGETHSAARVNVTLHRKMSRNVPDGHFCVFIFSESTFYANYNGEIHFQIREVAELHVFEKGGTTFGTFEKTCFKC